MPAIVCTPAERPQLDFLDKVSVYSTIEFVSSEGDGHLVSLSAACTTMPGLVKLLPQNFEVLPRSSVVVPFLNSDEVYKLTHYISLGYVYCSIIEVKCQIEKLK